MRCRNRGSTPSRPTSRSASETTSETTPSRRTCSLSLNVQSVRLMTNNPDKIRQLEQHGTKVSGRIPHVIPPNDHNRFYLETKVARSGTPDRSASRPRLSEQDDPVIVESGS